MLRPDSGNVFNKSVFGNSVYRLRICRKSLWARSMARAWENCPKRANLTKAIVS